MRKMGKLHHLNRGGTAFQRMRSPENLINGLMVGRIIFYDKNIALKLLDLLFGFRKKVLEKFLIIRIKIVAHTSYYITKKIVFKRFFAARLYF